MHTSDFCFKNILQDIANGIGIKQKKSQIISFSYIFGLSGQGCELRVRDKGCLQYRPYLKFLMQNEPIIPNNPSNNPMRSVKTHYQHPGRNAFVWRSRLISYLATRKRSNYNLISES